MWEPIFTSKFRKDVKRLDRRGKRLSKLSDLIDFLKGHGDAPEYCRPHNLSGDWDGYRECHIEPDWLAVYTVEQETVTFHRTGTHSDLFR